MVHVPQMTVITLMFTSYPVMMDTPNIWWTDCVVFMILLNILLMKDMLILHSILMGRKIVKGEEAFLE